MNMTFHSRHKQHGAVLITGLIFLVILTLLGVTAMRMASLEERMSGNMRDRNLAFQTAEMGLRYAEQHIRAGGTISGVTGFDAICTAGLCYYGAGVAPPVAPAWVTYCAPACPIAYVAGTVFGAYTAPALPAGVPAPTYLIEGFRKTPPGSGMRYYYRISVRGQGAQPGTVVWLQEVFRP